MKGKKFHTLQAKLTLLVSMIILTSLIFSFRKPEIAIGISIGLTMPFMSSTKTSHRKDC